VDPFQGGRVFCPPFRNSDTILGALHRNPKAAVCARYRRAGTCPKFEPGGSMRCAFDHPPIDQGDGGTADFLRTAHHPLGAAGEILAQGEPSSQPETSGKHWTPGPTLPSSRLASTEAVREQLGQFMWQLRKHLRAKRSNLEALFAKCDYEDRGVAEAAHFRRSLSNSAVGLGLTVRYSAAVT